MTLRLGSIACKRRCILSARNELPPPVVCGVRDLCLLVASSVGGVDWFFSPSRRVLSLFQPCDACADLAALRPCALARTTHASKPHAAERRPLDAPWERGRPFRLRSHSASSSARTCDVVPALGSPQVCGPCGRIPPTLTRSSERLGHGFSPRFCRRAHQKRGRRARAVLVRLPRSDAAGGECGCRAPRSRDPLGRWQPG